jgi:hypothetical protein
MCLEKSEPRSNRLTYLPSYAYLVPYPRANIYLLPIIVNIIK